MTIPQENVETVRRAIDAFNDRNLEAMLPLYADDVTFRLIGGFEDLMGTEFSGHEGLREWFEDWVENLGARAEIERVRAVGGQVVVVLDTVAAGGASGAPARARSGQVYSFRDGLVCAVDSYWDHAAALEAVGLAE